MKSTAKTWMVIIAILSSYNGFSQIKNLADTSLKIMGNCAMCKKTIENAGNFKNEAQISWDKDTKVASITYDKNKTSPDEILKRVALAGYDSEEFLAPDDTYAKLPACCQYERELKPHTNQANSAMQEHHQSAQKHKQAPMNTADTTIAATHPLKMIYQAYFTLKDALVNSDQVLVSASAEQMLSNTASLDMNKLNEVTQTLWMQGQQKLSLNLKQIAKSNDLAKQRQSFLQVSEIIHELLQVSKHETTVYYQHCPMYEQGKGGHWLSLESTIKNPYYGASMLSCGNNLETIE